jgi:hypothetical protein
MVRVDLAIFLSLQALGAFASTIPTVAHNTREFNDAELSATNLFASGTIEHDAPGLSSPEHQALFDTTISDTNASSDTSNEKRSLAKRFLLDDWQEVDVRSCWSIDHINVDHAEYIRNVEGIINSLYRNGRDAIVLQPNSRWLFEWKNVRLVIRNQNACQTRQFISEELGQNVQAVYYRCQNPDLIFFIQPMAASYPSYSQTSC